MKQFLLRSLLISTPIVLLAIYYLILDPFRVIYSYDNIYKDTKVALNRDYVSMNNYIEIAPQYHPNAFIFGNSRSIVYRASSWRQYIGDSARVYHFDASGDDLFGMSQKISWLDRQGAQIQHALLTLDPDSFNTKVDKPAPLFNRPIQLNDQTTLLTEHWSFFKNFIQPKFFVAYNDWILFSTMRPYMNGVLDNCPFIYDRRTNQIEYSYVDSIIEVNPTAYYTKERMEAFPARDTTSTFYCQPLISDKELARLESVKAIFDKHRTDYRVIIHPLYNLKKLALSDMAKLRAVFGSKLVFDFSGYNAWTKDYHNYYEWSHYRSNLSDSVLKSTYSYK